jgi:hypothetical protein
MKWIKFTLLLFLLLIFNISPQGILSTLVVNAKEILYLESVHHSCCCFNLCVQSSYFSWTVTGSSFLIYYWPNMIFAIAILCLVPVQRMVIPSILLFKNKSMAQVGFLMLLLHLKFFQSLLYPQRVPASKIMSLRVIT